MLWNQVLVDEQVFNQLRELDDEGNTEFSDSIMEEWIVQVKNLLEQMDDSSKHEEFGKFSGFACHAKDSSMEIGAIALQRSLDELQHLGAGKDESPKNIDLSEETIRRIEPILSRAKKEYEDTTKLLKVKLDANLDHGNAPEKLKTLNAGVAQ